MICPRIVVPLPIFSKLLLHVSRRLVNRRDDRTSTWIRLLPNVYRVCRKPHVVLLAAFGHTRLGAPSFFLLISYGINAMNAVFSPASTTHYAKILPRGFTTRYRSTFMPSIAPRSSHANLPATPS